MRTFNVDEIDGKSLSRKSDNIKKAINKLRTFYRDFADLKQGCQVKEKLIRPYFVISSFKKGPFIKYEKVFNQCQFLKIVKITRFIVKISKIV
jgi:hypothetical protein